MRAPLFGVRTEADARQPLSDRSCVGNPVRWGFTTCHNVRCRLKPPLERTAANGRNVPHPVEILMSGSGRGHIAVERLGWGANPTLSDG